MAIRVVVPLDGTPVSESILPVVRGLAGQLTLRVTLVSVVDTALDHGWADEPRLRNADATISEVSAREQYLRARAGQLEGIHVDVIVRLGKAPDEILDAADEHSADLIAIASRAHSGIRRFFVGSVASRVLQGSDCPVLVLRYAGEQEPAEPLQVTKVLIPLDGSAFGEAALNTARELFGDSVALHLVQVVEPLTFSAYDELEAYSAIELQEITDRTIEGARDYLGKLANRLERDVPRVTWDVHEGSGVAAGIERAASESGADLIAMSTHGRSGLGRFFLGSVAERVLQDADYPILMVRPPSE